MGHLHGSLGTAAHALAAPQSPSCPLHPPTAGQAHSRAHGAHRSAAKSIATCECSVPNGVVGRVGPRNDAILALSCHLPARTEQRQAVPWAHKIVRRVSEERSGRAAWDRSRKGGIGKWLEWWPTVRALARGAAHPRRVSLLVGEHRVVCAAATGRWLRACRASSWFTRQGWWLMATAAAQERSSVKSSWRTRAPKRLLSPLRRGRARLAVRSPFQVPVHVQPVPGRTERETGRPCVERNS